MKAPKTPKHNEADRHRSGDLQNRHTLTHRQQHDFLGKPLETAMNLGHRVPDTEANLKRNPQKDLQDYDVARNIATGPYGRELRGQYGRSANPKSGISTQENLDAWSDRATSNTQVTGEVKRATRPRR